MSTSLVKQAGRTLNYLKKKQNTKNGIAFLLEIIGKVYSLSSSAIFWYILLFVLSTCVTIVHPF